MTVSDEIQQLFNQATVTEACLVSLEHMSVHIHRVMKVGGINRFTKNCISFAQDIQTWFVQAGLLRPFREGDPVNSSRGPRGDLRDARRAPVMAEDATAADRKRYATDEKGHLVFPGRVKQVLDDGRIVVEYRDGGEEGLELRENLEHRIRLPWSPKVLRGIHVIMLRRGMRYGMVLEGLEARWGLVSRLLEVLTRVGHFRLDGELGPMHRYYDLRLFDVDSEQEILAKYAPQQQG